MLENIHPRHKKECVALDYHIFLKHQPSEMDQICNNRSFSLQNC